MTDLENMRKVAEAADRWDENDFAGMGAAWGAFYEVVEPEAVISLLDQITALERERDALLGAAGFKPGPVKDVVLADLAGMRPAMVKARRQQREVESDAMLWQMASHERGHFGGEGLLWAVWQQRKEAEKRAKAAEAKATALQADKERLEASEARWIEAHDELGLKLERLEEALREIGPMLTCAETLLKSAGFWVNAAGHMTDAAVWIDRAQAAALLNREG